MREIKKMGEKIKKMSCASSKKATTKRLDIPKQQAYRNHIPEKLIPELSRLLDEGKINPGSASLYAKVSTKNQKKIYDTLMDNLPMIITQKQKNQ